MNNYGLIFCDAGATNQAMAHLRAQGIKNINGFFLGPAATIYKEYFPYAQIMSGIEEVIKSSDFLITGTSWSTDIEHKARISAAKTNVVSIAIIDHWVNYTSRFEFNGVTQMPDQIWVHDSMAYDRAKISFNNTPIKLKNPDYKNLILQNVSKVPERPNSFLYLCEPMRRSMNDGTTLEEHQLFTFLQKLSVNKTYVDPEVFIRLHPSEHVNKYDGIIREYSDLDINIDCRNLSGSLSRSAMVVGCSSYALYLAYCANRKVISSKVGQLDNHVFNLEDIFFIEEL